MLRRIPIRSLLILLLPLSLSSAAATGIAIGVVEWRQESVDLRPIDERLADLERGLPPIEGLLKGAEARLGALSEEVETLRSDVRALAPTAAVPSASSLPAPAARLSVNWVQRYCGGCQETAVCVTIENTSDSGVSIPYSYSQFSAVDGDNFTYPPRLHTPGYSIQLKTPLMTGELGPGEKRKGELLYDVPPQAVLSRLVWNAGFGETPEIALDLPAAQGDYSYSSQC